MNEYINNDDERLIYPGFGFGFGFGSPFYPYYRPYPYYSPYYRPYPYYYPYQHYFYPWHHR